MRSRPGLVGHEVATWLGCSGSQVGQLELMSRHHFEVATWVAAREVAIWRRDIAEMGLNWVDVTTSF